MSQKDFICNTYDLKTVAYEADISEMMEIP